MLTCFIFTNHLALDTYKFYGSSQDNIFSSSDHIFRFFPDCFSGRIFRLYLFTLFGNKSLRFLLLFFSPYHPTKSKRSPFLASPDFRFYFYLARCLLTKFLSRCSGSWLTLLLILGFKNKQSLDHHQINMLMQMISFHEYYRILV